jgi:hypothetical protein
MILHTDKKPETCPESKKETLITDPQRERLVSELLISDKGS